MIRNLRNCIKVPFRKHPSYNSNLREQPIENRLVTGFSLHTFASYVLSGNPVFSFIYNWSILNTVRCNESAKNPLYMCIMAKQFDMKHFFFFVKKPCQTDFNSNKQPLESEAAVKKDKKSDLTESMDKYIFFLCLMVKKSGILWTLDICSILVTIPSSFPFCLALIFQRPLFWS